MKVLPLGILPIIFLGISLLARYMLIALSIIGIYWLVLLGEWHVLLYAVLGILLGLVLLHFAFLPGILLDSRVKIITAKNSRLKVFSAGFKGAIILATAAIFSLWFAAVFYFLNRASSPDATLPALMAAYCVCVIPFGLANTQASHSSFHIILTGCSLVCAIQLLFAWRYSPGFAELIILALLSHVVVHSLFFWGWKQVGTEEIA